MSRCVKILVLLASFLCAAAMATTVQELSNNVNGMRQLGRGNIVQQWPGAAPYYGPNQCQQQLANFQAQAGPGYACSCPTDATSPVCTPICSVLLPSYQDQAGPTMSCACPAENQVPVCTPLSCEALIPYYSQQNPGATCSCPVNAATPVCVMPPPTCAQLLPSYQAQYQSQNPSAPVTCSCPDPNAQTNPVCTCGNNYTGYWWVQWGSYDGGSYGWGTFYIDAYSSLKFLGWSWAWTGEFAGSGSVTGGGQATFGSVLAGQPYSFWGSFSSNNPTTGSANGGYMIDDTNQQNSANSGWWHATKYGSFSSNCSAGPNCSDILAATAPLASSAGSGCQCFAGSTAKVMPGCNTNLCNNTRNSIPAGSWSFNVSNGLTCIGNVYQSPVTTGAAPAVQLFGYCSDGSYFQGTVACDSTLGQSFGGSGVVFSGGNMYPLFGTFYGPSFSGSVPPLGLTVSGYKN